LVIVNKAAINMDVQVALLCPGVVSLHTMVVLFLGFGGTSMLFFIAVALIPLICAATVLIDVILTCL
jgi:hypothetical protein